MSYVFLFILFLPIKVLRKLFHRNTNKNLVIQTAKIGDFINITPLLRYLEKSDVLISNSVAPLAKHDSTIETIFFIEKEKRNLFAKLRFAWKIVNRYDNVYLLYPNAVNLFFAAICNAKNKQFLSINSRRWYHCFFYMTATGVIYHGIYDLTLKDYLHLANRALNYEDIPKHATYPLYQPKSWPECLDKKDVIRIGLSISAGDRIKTIPSKVWKKIFDILSDKPCVFYIFGTQDEQEYLNDLYQIIGKQNNIISLIGLLPLEDVPFAISKMNCYIASDSGNIYIADAVNIPVILLFGPCCYYEQRPLGKTLLLGNDSNICRYIFNISQRPEQSQEKLFTIDEIELSRIYEFVNALSIK